MQSLVNLTVWCIDCPEKHFAQVIFFLLRTGCDLICYVDDKNENALSSKLYCHFLMLC